MSAVPLQLHCNCNCNRSAAVHLEHERRGGGSGRGGGGGRRGGRLGVVGDRLKVRKQKEGSLWVHKERSRQIPMSAYLKEESVTTARATRRKTHHADEKEAASVIQRM